MSTILVTGANGFVGRHLVSLLASKRCNVKKVVRREIEGSFTIGEINGTTNWGKLLDDTDVVVHCAARVHIVKDTASNPLDEFRKTNTEGTLHLARCSANAGVKRFVFISSIKVNGEITQPGEKFSADDNTTPVDPYGISKFEAEEGLRDIAKQTGMEVVIIRPPLVYGPGVKANFESMMKWLKMPIVLPFGSLTNKRSLVYISNLVSLIEVCTHHPKAANNTFMISDDNDLYTSDLFKRLKIALRGKCIIVNFPEGLLKFLLKLIGRDDLREKICSSLLVDISKTKSELNWCPPFNVSDGLNETANFYLNSQERE